MQRLLLLLILLSTIQRMCLVNDDHELFLSQRDAKVRVSYYIIYIILFSGNFRHVIYLQHGMWPKYFIHIKVIYKEYVQAYLYGHDAVPILWRHYNRAEYITELMPGITLTTQWNSKTTVNFYKIWLALEICFFPGTAHIFCQRTGLISCTNNIFRRLVLQIV